MYVDVYVTGRQTTRIALYYYVCYT